MEKYQNSKLYEQFTPYPLQKKKQFVCMKLTWNAEKGKFSKLPINPLTGNNAQVNNPDTWADFKTACGAVDKFGLDGIGYILTGTDGIVGIDLDLKSGELTENGKKILSLLENKTYIEHSVSGAIHIFGYGKKQGSESRGKEDSSLEMYGGDNEGNRCLMLTGKLYKGKFVKLGNIQKLVDQIHQDYFKRPEVVRENVQPTALSMSENEIIEKIKYSKSGLKFERLMSGDTSMHDGDYSKADLALCGIIAFFTQDRNQIDRIYRQSGLYSAQKFNEVTGKNESRSEKWHSRRWNGTYGSNTIDLAIKNVLKTYNPQTLKQDVKKK